MNDMTDEQIDFLRANIRDRQAWYLLTGECEEMAARYRDFDVLIAAVEARAARRERERITRLCDRYRARLYADEANRETTKPARDALSWVTAKLRNGTTDDH